MEPAGSAATAPRQTYAAIGLSVVLVAAVTSAVVEALYLCAFVRFAVAAKGAARSVFGASPRK